MENLASQYTVLVVDDVPTNVMLDIMMPEMDGYEVLQHLKSNPETNNIPVIIMSALSDMQSIVKGYQLGATEYVTKPFQREELVKRVAHRYNRIPRHALFRYCTRFTLSAWFFEDDE